MLGGGWLCVLEGTLQGSRAKGSRGAEEQGGLGAGAELHRVLGVWGPAWGLPGCGAGQGELRRMLQGAGGCCGVQEGVLWGAECHTGRVLQGAVQGARLVRCRGVGVQGCWGVGVWGCRGAEVQGCRGARLWGRRGAGL